MEKEALKRIFNFLEEKGENRAPLRWKILNNIPLTKEDLNVKGNLILRNTNITSLPEGLIVGYSLYIVNTKICSLPEGLIVGDSLIMNNTKISSLPKGLKVRFWLDLINTKITSLPEGLKVGGSLFIKQTALLEYTDEELREMIKPGFIKGKIFR